MRRPRCQSYCRSPIACSAFGYCRQRNSNGLPDKETERAWQREDNAPEPEESRDGS